MDLVAGSDPCRFGRELARIPGIEEQRMECHFGGTVRTNLPTTGSIAQLMLGRELASPLSGSGKKSQLIGQTL